MPKRRTRLGALLLVVGGVALVACSDDPAEPGEAAIEPFVGSWSASEFEFSPVESGSPTAVDLVDFGVSLHLEVEGDGGFVLTQVAPDGGEGVNRGVLEVDPSAGRITFLFEGEGEDPLSGSFFFSQDQRVLNVGLPGARFDFNGNGETVPARVRLVFQKE